MDFGENFKRICKERNTSPSAVVKKLGYSTSKVTAWYHGSLPKQDVLVQLAKELDCDVMDFFQDESSQIGNRYMSLRDNNTTNNYYHSCDLTSIRDADLIFQLLDIVRSMSDDDLKHLIKYAGFISNNGEIL